MTITTRRCFELQALNLGGPFQVRPPGWGFTLIIVLLAFALAWAARTFVQMMAAHAVNIDEARRLLAPCFPPLMARRETEWASTTADEAHSENPNIRVKDSNL